MTTQSEKTVREIALENPASIRIFESLGIDYCCGGKQCLSEACASAQVPVERVLGLLATPQPAPEDDAAWNDAPLSQLTQHIVERHHEFVRRETPRIDSLLAKVISRHGPAHPELPRIKDVFAALAQELLAHMFKEEQVLFPEIEQLDAALREHRRLPRSPFGSIKRPIALMTADHENAGDLLRQLSDLTGGYQLPPGACPTYSGLYHALQDFERDLHLHIHLENNILFPRAIELEQRP